MAVFTAGDGRKHDSGGAGLDQQGPIADPLKKPTRWRRLQVKALVTGAGGFIGRWLCRILAENGYDVTSQSERELPGSWGPRTGLVGSLADERFHKSLPTDVDAVFHLASEASQAAFRASPQRTLSRDFTSLINVLARCATCGPARFVYVSSALVYDRTDSAPKTEEARVGAWSYYAASKISSEALSTAYASASGFQCTIARLFNVYGPDQTALAVVPELIAKGRRGRIEIRAANPVRDFVHVVDVCLALIKMAASASAQGATLNVGTGIGRSIGQVGEEIGAALAAVGNRPEVAVARKGAELTVDRTDHLVADISKIGTMLQWQPRIPFSEGIAAIVRGDDLTDRLRPDHRLHPAGFRQTTRFT